MTAAASPDRDAASPDRDAVDALDAGARSGFQARVDALSPAKRALLAGRLAKRGGAGDAVVPVARTGEIPLSSAQRRLWFMDQLTPANAVLNLSAAVRFTGRLRVDVLGRSVNALLARHESLRTVFASVGGTPLQRFLPRVEADLTPVRLSAEEVKELAATLRTQTSRPFSLERGPLARGTLFRCGADDHVLLLTIHHSVCDGWSMGILVDELLALYRAGVRGQEAAIAPVRLQFADYAAWQARPERDAPVAESLEYWRRALRGALPLIELPVDRPRPAVQSFRGARSRFALPPGVWAAVQDIARAERATPFMVLLAGFAALMARHSAQSETTVAVPVANRPRPELEKVVGCFANSVVLRVDTSGSPTFRELVRRAREVTQDGIAHGHVPFDRVVEVVAPERSLRHAPIAQVSFALVTDLAWEVDLGEVRAAHVDHHNGMSQYDLSVEVWPGTDGELRGTAEYAADLFDEPTVARLTERFGTLLAGLTRAPDTRIGHVQLLSGDELRRTVAEWNDTDAPVTGPLAHEAFEEQARRTPELTALVSGERTVTFAELDRLADRLAARLHRAGVRPETRVALLLHRDVELVVAVLAVLKAGGVYLPLDAGDPAERIAFLLADSAARVVVTSRAQAASLPSGDTRVLLTEDVDDDDAPPERARWPRPHPDNACYLVYTSGSTGRPKGVVVTHRGLRNYLAWSVDAYRVAAGGGAPLVSPLRFDLSVTTLFCPLLAGRSVVLVREGDELDVLAKSLTGTVRFGLVKLTPAHLESLDRVLPREAARADGFLVVGGESLPGSTVAAWRERLPGLRVVNEYGPTETVVGCCSYEVGAHTDLTGTVPIGRPIANTRLYPLDANLMPVVPGAVGELYVGGVGVARGYWNRPGLTAERFVPDPFAATPGARMYRTGDLVRMRADGNLECLGRTDTQVKVRGHRVELEEIEAALTRMPAVREAVVLQREDVPGDRRLVAYLTPAGADQAPPGVDAGAELRRELPDYMVPQSFVWLGTLPLAKNGKVDRRALPRPVLPQSVLPRSAQDDLDAGQAAPATPLEEVVASVWAAVLGLPRVGRDANFLDLGGHSLLATQAVARLRDVLDMDLPLRVFFEATTLADLAARIANMRARAPRPRITHVPRTEPVPLSYAQGRLYFLSRLAEDSTFYHVPVVLRFDGKLRGDAFRDAFAALWARHDGLRTYFPACDPDPVQEVLPAGDVPFAVRYLDDGKAVDGLIDEAMSRPFDFSTGPLVRAELVRVDPDTHVFLMTMHHVVSDGWSLGIVLDELMALYRAFATGEPSPLPPLPCTYADYTVWQRSWLAGAELEAQLGYWTRMLRGAPALELPADRPRPAVQSFRGARHRMTWSPELSRAIRALARAEGMSLFMVLLAGFDVFLARSSGQLDVTVGTPIANRTTTELERLVGYFANTLALRVDLSGAATFADVLHRVRDRTLGAYENQDVPFELVVDAVGAPRDLSHSPLFQVRFALQNHFAGLPGCGPGLTVTALYGEQRTSRFDLVVDMWENGDTLEGYAEYSTDLFDAATIARMMGRFEGLFERLVRDPGERVFRVELMSAAERTRVDQLSRGAELPAGADALTFPQRFAEQAARHPEWPAVTCGAQTLSYGELRRRAGDLARVLVARGVGPEVLVGVYLDRGIDVVVAVLAVLEAGGAYVPLDPGYPSERTALIVADTGPALVLTSRHLARSAPGNRLVLEDVRPVPAGGPTPAIRPGHPAYVIHTSGTKGRPKGVVVTHGSLAAYVSALPSVLPLPGKPVFLHTASFAFSSSVRQLAVPLACGGRVVIAERDRIASPDSLLDYAVEHGVDVLDVVPSYLRVLAPALAGLDRNRPGVILTASEPLLCDLPEQIRGAPGEVPRLVNMYGQTETTGIVTTAPVPAVREGRGAVVPLGRPIPGVRVHVLGADLRPAPLGHFGEIYIGGSCLARGYLGDPACTAERFVASPFGPPGSRLYRTGDRGRFLPGGNLEFLGRVGDQAKIRGHRVEPQEVASVLSALDGVGECAVLCVEDGADERRLIGYVAPAVGAAVWVASLRAALKEKLPDYMIPALVPVGRLPRLPNGKVDHLALRAIKVSAGEVQETKPRNEREQTFASIWRDVLRLPEVGIHDHFFELGGDSLHAVRVVDRARKAGLTITPAQFIANPTIAELAAVATAATEAVAAVAAERGRRDEAGEIPLVPSHYAFLEREFPDKQRYIHIFQFETATTLDAELVARAVACVIAHHDALRITFPRGGDTYRVAVRERFDPTPFRFVDLSALERADQDVALGRLKNSLERTFDYANGPLLHFALVRLGSGRPDRLVAMVHHQLMDNSSWSVLIEDLQASYAALAEGAAPRLAPPTATFAQWARDMDRLARSAELDADVGYWTGLARRPVPRVPVDHQDGDNCMTSEEATQVGLDAAETGELRRMLAREHGLSMNDALLAALLRGFADWTGQTSVLVDLVARGRELGAVGLDLSRAIGRFSVTSPRLLELPHAAGPRALLESVGEQVRAVPRGGLGFGLLRYLGTRPCAAAALEPIAKPDILLSNWGDYGQDAEDSPLLGPPLDDPAPPPKLPRMHRLIVNTRISGGALAVVVRYSRNLHERASIERFADRMAAALRSFVPDGS
jgi:surfactin family lipopeptide synthetase A